jgi:DNA topoisomerase-2
VNGTLGIGTGYSTYIPCFNPSDVIENINLILLNKEPRKLIPWYKGFNGTVTEEGTAFMMRGTFRKLDKSIHISEIPINISISDYKEYLESFEEFTVLNNSSENNPDFTLKFRNAKDMEKFNHKSLKLEYKINTSNMHLFDVDNKIKKYDDPNDIIRDFLKNKLEFVKKRKNHLIKIYDEELHILKYKNRFLEEIIDDKLDIFRKSKKDTENILQKSGYPKIENSYSYITSIQVSSFTSENLLELDNKIKNITDKKISLDSKSCKDLALDDLNNLKKYQ